MSFHQPFLTFVVSLLLAIFASKQAVADFIRVGLLLPERAEDLFGLEKDVVASMERLRHNHNLFFASRYATNAAEAQAFANELGRKNFNILVTLGPRFRDVWHEMASYFPKTQFIVLDGEDEASPYTGLVFDEHRAAFILGTQVASQTISKRLAFVGAVDNPSIRRVLLAFRAGVRLVDQTIVIEERFVSSTAQGWQDLETAQTLVESLLLRPLDALFLALGPNTAELVSTSAMNEWLTEQPQRLLLLAGRQDLQQLSPQVLQRSVLLLKRGDLAMEYVLQLFTEKSLKPGILNFGLSAGGVQLVEGTNRSRISTKLEADQRLRVIRQDVLNGQIKVPDYFRVF
ncbi:MAG: BMP family ABC transporter substrate-binding protein [Oligoflexus sp.]